MTLIKSTHLGYIIAAANLHAYNYGLRGGSDPSLFRKIADAVIVPEFSPKSGVKIQINDNDPVSQAGQISGGMCIVLHDIT